MLDFALPPRCAGCAEVIDEVDGFCARCWSEVNWIGVGGCRICGIPLEATEADECGGCLAAPPPLDRMRAAVAYGDVPRTIALRLKYGRKIALARTMARFMAPLRGVPSGDEMVVPVPLHRWRLWSREFNQSALVAAELGRRWQLPVEPLALRRARATPPLKGMSHGQRRSAVAGHSRSIPSMTSRGGGSWIDYVLTSGSTAEACAKALRKAGARRVELISWARVVRPAHVVR